jgi:broad specificity phosphatase PhoE
MNKELPVIYLARDGETVWSIFGQHTGRDDLPLGERGENNARRRGDQFRERRFAREITSLSQRTCRTSELAGFHDQTKSDGDLLEWNYGEYDGLETADFHAERPASQPFCDGRPGGESAGEVGAPADRAVDGAGPTRRDVFDFLERALAAGAGWTVGGMSGRQMVPAEHGKRERA